MDKKRGGDRGWLAGSFVVYKRAAVSDLSHISYN